MKKLVKFSTIALAALFAFSACSNEEDDAVAVQSSAPASITGQVTADLDQSDGDADPEGVSGLAMFLSYNTENLDITPDAGRTYETIVLSTTTDGDGNFSFSVPTSPDGDIEYTVTHTDIEVEYQDAADETQSTVLSGISVDVTGVLPGMTVIVEDFEDVL